MTNENLTKLAEALTTVQSLYDDVPQTYKTGIDFAANWAQKKLRNEVVSSPTPVLDRIAKQARAKKEPAK
jgi:hypothetical protein